MRVLMVSAGCDAVAAKSPAITPAAAVADPSGRLWKVGCAWKTSRSTGITPRYPPVYNDSRVAVAPCAQCSHRTSIGIAHCLLHICREAVCTFESAAPHFRQGAIISWYWMFLSKCITPCCLSIQL